MEDGMAGRPCPSSPRRRLYEPEAFEGGEWKRIPFISVLKFK
jgi:hypothetical protein